MNTYLLNCYCFYPLENRKSHFVFIELDTLALEVVRGAHADVVAVGAGGAVLSVKVLSENINNANTD